jgi:hypothetical protein
VQGGSKGEIYKAADAMGRIAIRDGKRVLLFSPTDAAFGKNPGQLEPMEVPRPELAPDFLAGVIQSIKDRLNQLTEEQAAAQQVLEDWRAIIGELETPEHFNEKLTAVKQAPKAAQALFAESAKARGLVFDAKSKQYKEPAEAAA